MHCGATMTLRDLDHVVMGDGRICRVVGNLDDPSYFLGYNVYSPGADGDRRYRGRRYKKNFIEDVNLPSDVLDMYEILSVKGIAEHHDPIESAKAHCTSFRSTVWFGLYRELVDLFGQDSVGIFGSSMFGLHTTPEGAIRKDIDFVIQGIKKVSRLRQHLPVIRNRLGFTAVTAERQLQQYARYQRVFRNENNSIRAIIERRWTALQLSESVVSTIRLRDPTFTMPIELVAQPSESLDDVVVSGRVAEADGSNLFPRKFALITEQGRQEICIFWWKFSTPVVDGDLVTLCGSLVPIGGRHVLRLSSFTRHWLKITE